jgi:hypothetical protein
MTMSSVEFHEDEWGRHWSYAPALRGTRVRLNYPLFSSLLQGLVALAETISARYALHQAQALALSNPAKLHDIYGNDDVPPVLYSRYEGVKDEFGRSVG